MKAKCPDCNGIPGIHPLNRCPVCHVKSMTDITTQSELREIIWANVGHDTYNDDVEVMIKSIEAYKDNACRELRDRLYSDIRHTIRVTSVQGSDTIPDGQYIKIINLDLWIAQQRTNLKSEEK